MGDPAAEAEARASFDVATAEAEVGASFDVAIAKDESVGAMIIEENVEVFTVESSLEWMGTLIEEETEMEETREDVGIRNIPSTLAAELESPLP